LPSLFIIIQTAIEACQTHFFQLHLLFAENYGEKGPSMIQTALFSPKGLAGILYWYLLYPVHKMIFRDLAGAIIRDAERTGNGIQGNTKGKGHA